MLALSFGSCRVYVDFSCFVLLAFCCLFAGGVGSAFVLSAAALHELAHILALLIFRSPPKTVTVTALGCRIVPDTGRSLRPLQSCMTLLAGPVMNLLLFGAGSLFQLKNALFFTANLALGFFHILPIEPLDGGMALRTALSNFVGWQRAGRITRIITILLLLPLAVLGLLVLLQTHYNFSLLAISLYLMLYLLLGRDYLPE